MVGTVKKSMAAIASRWLCRKASQRLAGPGSLGARRIQREMVLNGSLGEVETQRQELTVNTRSAPGRIFRHHPEDQILNFLGNSSSANDPAGSGNGLLIECESGIVPTHNGLGAYDNQRLLPSRPESPH